MLFLRQDSSLDQRVTMLARAVGALEEFITEDIIKTLFPRSRELAEPLLAQLRAWLQSEQHPLALLPNLLQSVQFFSTIVMEEMDRTHVYTVIDKGNLSVDKLVEGASKGYPPEVLALLDKWMCDEINDSGRCMAFTLYTACGFHILRAVEIGIKGYVHAATGTLPPTNRRNWGEYINLLNNAGAGSDLVDLLRILKAKRNPLMHPQEKLEEAEAVDLFCICQAVIGSLVADVKRRSLDTQFSSSLKILPTL
jgi:hypothetical protein